MIRTSAALRATRRSLLVLSLLAAVLAFAPNSAGAAKDEALIKNFPSVAQWYRLDCEYTAAAAVTLYWGNLVSQRDFLSEVPSSPNPHLDFRGDINGEGAVLPITASTPSRSSRCLSATATMPQSSTGA